MLWTDDAVQSQLIARMSTERTTLVDQAAEPKAAPGEPVGSGQHCSQTPSRGSDNALPAFIPQWLGLFLGKQFLRFCSSGSKYETCEGCDLRAMCKCAHEQMLQAAAIERKVWAMLASCGGAVILYAVVSALLKG
jgi:hypothetical protein